MDGLSAAASVAAIVDVSAKVTSLCFQYSVAVKDAKKDIDRLQRTVTDVKNVLEEVKHLLDGQDKPRLSTLHKLSDLLERCHQQLEGLKAQLQSDAPFGRPSFKVVLEWSSTRATYILKKKIFSVSKPTTSIERERKNRISEKRPMSPFKMI